MTTLHPRLRVAPGKPELAESIPPAYTEYIGAQLLMLNRARGAA